MPQIKPASVWQRLSICFSSRVRVLAAVVFFGLVSFAALDLSLSDLRPTAAGWKKCQEFFGSCFAPAFDYERVPPTGTQPLLLKVAASMVQTVAFAGCSIGLAIIGGLLLGFLSSSAWWSENDSHRSYQPSQRIGRVVRPMLMWLCRSLVVFLRSIHELVWAVILLSAFGLNNATAILAIAIPYSGVFAKIFSEFIDETPRDSANALQLVGAPGVSVFLVGLLPRALPDMVAYVCYRFECAVRSCAVMGFFGIPTLGYYLQPAFEEQHFREAWTYLYALLTLVVTIDVWSGCVRRRLVR
jgi:phosphonate transport system permease protein